MTKVGVVVARFQVPELHEGHISLLRHAIQHSDHLVVMLGVSELDGRTAENPLLVWQRILTVSKWLHNNSVQHNIYPLHNNISDHAWSEDLDRLLTTLFPLADITLYVGRGSVVPACYRGKYKIEILNEAAQQSGTAIRAGIQPSANWMFLAGQTFALNYQHPKAYQCVDIGVYRNDGKILLIKRPDTGEWCFPGGFVDPTDKSLEDAAKRELFEETRLSCETQPRYVGSALINDWRYRGRDKIISALFAVPHSFGRPENTMECLASKWEYPSTTGLAPHHAVLGRMMTTFLGTQAR